MKKYVLLLLYLYFFPQNAYAEERPLLTVDGLKSWTITFSEALDDTTLNEQTIYIETATQQKHPVSISLQAEHIVIVEPLQPYTSSEPYTLVIQDVKSRSQRSLVEISRQPFTVSNHPSTATWIWNAYDLNLAYVDFLIQQRTEKVFVQVDYDLPMSAYVPFFEKLQQHNIEIYALEGIVGTHWFDQPYYEQRYFNWVETFQQQYGYFDGIHIDAEPYISPTWHTAQQQVLQQYFHFLQRARTFADNAQLRFEVDMPFWFDIITYTNSFGSGNVAQFIINLTDEVTIMAYRNSANAIIDVAKEEYTYARQQQKDITIAIETLPSDEGDFLSFFDQPYTFLPSIYAVHEAFDSTIAIHYLQAWMSLHTK